MLLRRPHRTFGSGKGQLRIRFLLQRLQRLVCGVVSSKFWTKYVDDIFMTLNERTVFDIHQLLNATLPGILFTTDAPTNDRSTFLDVLVQKLPGGDLQRLINCEASNINAVLLFNSPGAYAGQTLLPLIYSNTFFIALLDKIDAFANKRNLGLKITAKK